MYCYRVYASDKLGQDSQSCEDASSMLHLECRNAKYEWILGAFQRSWKRDRLLG